MNTIGVSFLDPLDDYELIHRIGCGTYGDVFKARNIRTSEIAAIKIVKLDPGDDITSIQQEITMMKECKHKNIEHQAEKQIAYVCRETLQGLHHLHEAGKMHRDIKGANILLTERGDVKLADFGVAAEISASVAKRKSFIGTPYWMAPEVAAVEKKGGYNHLCDIWAVGITAIELAELQPPMFELHPMRALMLMSKSSFQPPRLKDKTMWSTVLQSFIKMSLIKNPRKRPSAETLLQHPFVTQLLTRNLVIELLDTVNNPELHPPAHSMEDGELEIEELGPDKIQSAGKHLPLTKKVTDPELQGSYDDYWSLSGEEDTSPSLLECVEQALQLRSLTIRRAPSSDGGGRKSALFSPTTASLPAFSCLSPEAAAPEDVTPRPSCTLGPASAVASTCSAASSPGLSSTLRTHTEDSTADWHGLPHTPQVHMGACFSKVFNGCPLKIHCAVTWILPKTRDQYLILGAEEGVYTLNLNELHEDTLEKLLPQRCTWLYVMSNVLMSVSGREDHLKYAVSVKIPDTKSCRRCSVARNPYTDSTFLCGAVPSGLVLLLWYEPLQKFMQLKHIAIALPESLPVFELLVLVSDEFPQLCIGVRRTSPPSPDQNLHFDIVELNGSPNAAPDTPSPGHAPPSPLTWTRPVTSSHLDTPSTPSHLAMPSTPSHLDTPSTPSHLDTPRQVTQLDRDTVLIALEKSVKIVNLQGLPSKELTNEMPFDFPIETLVCLQDSILAFWKHGLKGMSLHSNEVTQEITDKTRLFKVLGTKRDIILQSTPTDDPHASSNLYILTGHENSY
ncbi:hypothetical protein NHX12_013861 [Muraenolepis orangiensis]|uniref:Mitogen-activated protein kinase kinase kinase kinase n=1 Tax=Muraenolepis orangiensis TaxID=630683 RepID=A0A9Q0DA99_9TELE|nr:hypothetical protein NHX12_013861 [Muraenolepis orangiensis]